MFVKQCFGRHQKSGRAVAALCGAQVGERILQRVQPAVRDQSFDGGHTPAVAVGAEHEARQDRLVVEQHGTGAAFAKLAAMLRAAEIQVLTKNLEQRLVRRERDFGWLAVDDERD